MFSPRFFSLHFQLLQVALQEAQASVSDWLLLQSPSLPVHPQLHEAWVELTGHRQTQKGGNKITIRTSPWITESWRVFISTVCVPTPDRPDKWHVQQKKKRRKTERHMWSQELSVIPENYKAWEWGGMDEPAFISPATCWNTALCCWPAAGTPTCPRQKVE